MSADNGIYILCTNGEYRVAHCQAIENIDEDDKYLKEYFGACKVFTTREDALVEAGRQYDEVMNGSFPYIEYGIQFIDLGRKEFPE